MANNPRRLHLTAELRMRRFCTLILAAAIVAWPSASAFATTLITDIQVQETESTQVFILSATGAVTPKSFALPSFPSRLVIDFPDSQLDGPGQKGRAKSPIAGWRLAQTSLDPDVVRLALDWGGSPEAYTIDSGSKNTIRVTLKKQRIPGVNSPPTPEAAGTTAPSREVLALPSVEASSHMEKIIEETPATREAFPEITPTPRLLLPDLSKTKMMTLTTASTQIDFPQPLPRIEGAVYIPARDICRALGMTLTYNSTSKIFEAARGEEIKIEGKTGGSIIRVNNRDRSLTAPPRLIKNALYLPFGELLKNLGLGVLWEDSQKTLHIRPRLTAVRVDHAGGVSSLVITTTEPRTISQTALIEPPLQLDMLIPDVIADAPGTLEVSSPDLFTGGTIEPDMSGNVHLKLALMRKVLYAVDEEPLKNAIRVSFPSGIQVKTVAETERDIKITLQGTTRLSPEIRRMKEPSRIVIDFPGTLNRMEPLMTVEKGPVARLRTSQFKIDPPTTRLVIDMSQEGPFDQTLSEDGTTLTLSILKPAEAARREKAKQFAALIKRIIVIDAGHGGSDPGSRSVSGQDEKKLTLKVAARLSRRLAEAGAIPLLSREDDSHISLQDRVEFAERNQAEVLVSIHFNAFDTREKHGTETYYETPQSLTLAGVIHKNMVNGIRREDRGVRRVKFYVINNVSMPAVLVEPLYITNPDEDRLVQDDAFLNELAGDLFNGLLEYFRRYK